MGFEPPVPPGFYSDWQGEPKFIAAALELMNSRNAVEQLAVEIPPKVNKRRRRDGKLPFLGYQLLRIPGRYKHKHIASGEVDGRQLRAHFVRGHYKVRRTGVFFWSAFQRGNPTLGFVHKDYKLSRRTAYDIKEVEMKTHAIVQADRHSEREARVVIANVADLMNEKVMYKVEHHPEFNGVDLVATDNKIKIREDERKHIPAGYTSPFSGPNGNGL